MKNKSKKTNPVMPKKKTNKTAETAKAALEDNVFMIGAFGWLIHKLGQIESSLDSEEVGYLQRIGGFIENLSVEALSNLEEYEIELKKPG